MEFSCKLFETTQRPMWSFLRRKNSIGFNKKSLLLQMEFSWKLFFIQSQIKHRFICIFVVKWVYKEEQFLFAKTHSSRAVNGRSKFRRYNTRRDGGGAVGMEFVWEENGVEEQRVSLCFTRKWHKYVCVCVCECTNKSFQISRNTVNT